MQERERKYELGKYPRTIETREKNSVAMKRFWQRVRNSLEKTEPEIDYSGETAVE